MAATDVIRGRQTATRTLTNKSGGAVAVGDVVVIGDGTNDNAFTTTTTASFNSRMVGVAMEAIANAAAGLVAIHGYVPKVNTNASVTRDHFLFTHTVAKEATGSATRAAGAFGQVLETGADPEAIIWGMPDATAGGLDLSTLAVERAIQGITDYVAAYDGSAADERGFPVGFLRLSRQHTVIASDCFMDLTTEVLEGGVKSQASGAGAATAIGTADSNHPGVLAISTGTTTTGRCCLGNSNTAATIFLTGGKVRVLIVAKLTTLSDATETYTARLGLQTSFADNGTDAVMFRYSHGVNGGEWEGVCRAASVETVLDTNTLADTNWHTFEFEVNAAGTSVEFFIDGVSKGTIATNIPTASLTLIPVSIVKSAGTTARTMSVDAYSYIFEFTTAR